MENEQILATIAELRTKLERCEARIKELEEERDSIKTMEVDISYIKADLTEIKRDLKSVTEKPAKRWEAVVTTLISVVVGGVITYALTQMGVK